MARISGRIRARARGHDGEHWREVAEDKTLTELLRDSGCVIDPIAAGNLYVSTGPDCGWGPGPLVMNDPKADPPPERVKRQKGSEGPQRQLPARILIVDDEPAIADSLAEILAGSGYEAVAVYSFDAAIAAANEFRPDLLLTDVLMPDANGFELALQLKSALPSCRLLLFSGQAATAQLAQRFGHEFTRRGYHYTLLPKPIHPAVLLEKIHESLAHPG